MRGDLAVDSDGGMFHRWRESWLAGAGLCDLACVLACLWVVFGDAGTA